MDSSLGSQTSGAMLLTMPVGLNSVQQGRQLVSNIQPVVLCSILLPSKGPYQPEEDGSIDSPQDLSSNSASEVSTVPGYNVNLQLPLPNISARGNVRTSVDNGAIERLNFPDCRPRRQPSQPLPANSYLRRRPYDQATLDKFVGPSFIQEPRRQESYPQDTWVGRIIRSVEELGELQLPSIKEEDSEFTDSDFDLDSQYHHDSVRVKLEDEIDDTSNEQAILGMGSIGVNLPANEDVKVNYNRSGIQRKRRSELKKLTPPMFVFSVLCGRMVKRGLTDDCQGLRAKQEYLQYVQLSDHQMTKKNLLYKEADNELDWEDFEQVMVDR